MRSFNGGPLPYWHDLASSSLGSAKEELCTCWYKWAQADVNGQRQNIVMVFFSDLLVKKISGRNMAVMNIVRVAFSGLGSFLVFSNLDHNHRWGHIPESLLAQWCLPSEHGCQQDCCEWVWNSCLSWPMQDHLSEVRYTNIIEGDEGMCMHYLCASVAQLFICIILMDSSACAC